MAARGQSQAGPIRNLSVSKIEKFLQCPLAFKYRYIDKIPEASVWVLHSGKVVHAVIEHALRAFVRTGAYPDWKTLDDMFLPTWENMKKEEEEKPTFIGWQHSDIPEDQMIQQYRSLVKVAREDALPKISPWMIGDDAVIEHRIDLELNSEVGPFKLLGFIDLLDASGVLMDWKTTAKNEVSDRAKKQWLQFAAYSLFVWPLIGEEVVPCKKIFLVPGGPGEAPRVEWCQINVGPKHREWFINIAAQVWKSIQHGIYPARNDGWWCNDQFCSFYGPCQEGLKTS